MKRYSLFPLTLFLLVLFGSTAFAQQKGVGKGGVPNTVEELKSQIADLQGQIDTIELIEGPQGEQGLQGIKGDTGSQGPIGKTGPQGEQGGQGIQGKLGPQGLQGERGPEGQVGFRGAEGPRGLQGEIGPEGPQGVGGGLNLILTDSNSRPIGTVIDLGKERADLTSILTQVTGNSGRVWNIVLIVSSLQIWDAFNKPQGDIFFENTNCTGMVWIYSTNNNTGFGGSIDMSRIVPFSHGQKRLYVTKKDDPTVLVTNPTVRGVNSGLPLVQSRISGSGCSTINTSNAPRANVLMRPVELITTNVDSFFPAPFKIVFGE
jgi:hypothetical protein